jgi:hypothetical protein
MKTFDEIRSGQTEGEPQPKFEPIVGCPQCHKSDIGMTVGRQQINGCTVHKCYWFFGLNPYSRPLVELEAEQREQWIKLGFENFEQVEPWWAGQTATA